MHRHRHTEARVQQPRLLVHSQSYPRHDNISAPQMTLVAQCFRATATAWRLPAAVDAINPLQVHHVHQAIIRATVCLPTPLLHTDECDNVTLFEVISGLATP